MIEHCVPFIAIDNILLQIMFRYSEASLPENYVVHFTHYIKIVILRYYCLAKHCHMYINTIKDSIECECSWEFACCCIKASLSWVSTGFYGRCRSVSVISSLSSNSSATSTRCKSLWYPTGSIMKQIHGTLDHQLDWGLTGFLRRLIAKMSKKRESSLLSDVTSGSFCGRLILLVNRFSSLKKLAPIEFCDFAQFFLLPLFWFFSTTSLFFHCEIFLIGGGFLWIYYYRIFLFTYNILL